MDDRSSNALLPYLQGAGWVVVIMWGIRSASEVLSVILLSLLLAYGFVPLPRWLMRRFGLNKLSTMVVTAAMLGSLGLFSAIFVYARSLRLKARLPVYESRFIALHQSWLSFVSGYGVSSASLPSAKLSSAQGVLDTIKPYFPGAENLLLDGLLVALLALIFVLKMVETSGDKRGPLGERLHYYGGDVQRYIAVCVKTGLITALANLVVFFVFGVDFPGLWCILYFFLHFIPNVGFVFALVPPAFMALLMSGWQKALLVLGGMLLTQALSDYVLTPMLMKKEADISFLEITVALMLWGYLLGPSGAVLAIPLYLVIRKFLQDHSASGAPAGARPR